MKILSTLNVKSGSSGKYEKDSTLSVKKVWSVGSFSVEIFFYDISVIR